MPVLRLLRSMNSEDFILVQVRWKCLSNLKDTLEPLKKIYEDVRKMLLRVVSRKITDSYLAHKARVSLAI